MNKISYTSTKKVTLFTNHYYTNYNGERVKHTFATESTTVYKWNGWDIMDTLSTHRDVTTANDIRDIVKELLKQGAKMESHLTLPDGTKVITWIVEW